MDQKMLIVVSIISGRNFPRRPDCSLVVEAQFNKEMLSTDPVPHEGSTMSFGTELAWELNKKSLQQHKLNRTPIKLQCYAVNNATMSKENIGYVMLDLRTAQQTLDPIWHGILNSSYSRLKPQLQIGLTLEVEEGQSSQVPAKAERPMSPSGLTLTLDPGGGFYQLGPDSFVQQQMFTLSLTLQNARKLPQLPSGQTHFYFYYCLLGNDITSEPFAPPTFPAERASIRIRTNRQSLSVFMAAQRDMPLHLCCGSDSICKGYLTLSPLKSTDRVQCTLPLNKGDASIDVLVQIDKTPLSDSKPHPPSVSPLPESKGQSAALKPGSAARPTSALSAKRNLAQSFENASLTSSSASVHNGSPLSPDPAHDHSPPSVSSAPPPPHTLATPIPVPHSTLTSTRPAEPRPLASAISFPSVSSPGIHYATPTLSHDQMGAGSLVSAVSVPLPSIVTNSSPGVRFAATPTSARDRRGAGLMSQFSENVVVSRSLSSSVTAAVVSNSAAIPSTAAGPVGATTTGITGSMTSLSRSVGVAGSTHYSTSRVPPSHPGSGGVVTGSAHHGGVVATPRVDSSDPNEHRHYRYSIDLRSLQNSTMEPGLKCYLRYNYPFFGCPYPVLVQPPVILGVGPDSEVRFSQSFCSFDFAASYQQLLDHTSHQPLTVEVWQSRDLSHDQVVGLAVVPLGTVLSQEKTTLDCSTSTRQIFSLQAHITPPTRPTHPPAHSLGKLNVVLLLEDLGPIKVADSANLPRAGSKPTRVAQTPPKVPPSGQMSGNVADRMTKVRDHVTKTHGHGTEAKVSVEKDFTKSVAESAEYEVAMELEMWKLAEEDAFKEHLQSREATHMSQLGAEWRRREGQRQQLMKQKVEHYTALEQQLQEGLEKLQSQQKVLQGQELKLSQERDKLALERASLKTSHSREVINITAKHEQQLEMERLKSGELQHQVNTLKRQVHDLEVKVRTREAEFEKYRQELITRPESKLQAELSVAQLEKAELERKLTSLTKSKQHYKEQWSKALSELASNRQREQAVARNKLLTQQQELEALRVQYFQQEQQNSFRQQISEVKKDVNRLQEQTLHPQPAPQGLTTPPHPSPPMPPHSPHTSPRPPPSTTVDTRTLNADVARWIEERDILLQTGVYSGTDPTIQRLDNKIRTALAQLKNV